MQFKFIEGKSRGFSTSCFDWQKSQFSKFFHIKGATTEDQFIDAWDKFVAPSLDAKTGFYQSGAGNSTTTGSSRSQSSSSRKRKPEAEQSVPPSLQPKKVRKESTSSSSISPSANSAKSLDEEIRNGFVGMVINFTFNI